MSEPQKNPFDLLLDQIRLVVREEVGKRPNGTVEERLLDPEKAAQLLDVSVDWLYHNAKGLPFTRKLGPKMLRFSYVGMVRWMESKKLS